MGNYIMGVDLGQSQDPTAIIVLEVPSGSRGPRMYHLRHAERLALGTPYPVVAERIRSMMQSSELRGRTWLVVDATGVGMPVVDMLWRTGLRPIAVTITGGNTVVSSGPGIYSVPKRDLASVLQVLLQTERLRIARKIPQADILVQELRAFRVKINLTTGHDSYESWRESEHDDLVLAAAMACWYAENAWPGPRGPVRVVWGS